MEVLGRSSDTAMDEIIYMDSDTNMDMGTEAFTMVYLFQRERNYSCASFIPLAMSVTLHSHII